VSKKHKKQHEIEKERIDREESERFEELVEEALANLPPVWAERMENIDVAVEAWPSPDVLEAVGLGENDDLLGYYHGVPQTERSTSYGAVLPDRIEIYREPTLDEADATCPADGDFEATVRDIIRTTVLHEIGHHFGLSDDDLKRLNFD
jgi:predicted Zn-dependent protease with MMP-like domain